VTTAHETSDAFSDETLREQAVFQRAKEAEMKEMLGNFAEGQIEFYKAVRAFSPSLRVHNADHYFYIVYGRVGAYNSPPSTNSRRPVRCSVVPGQ
jgi:hypothetical protein